MLLWLVGHASRFVPREGERPETCWLEQRTREAARRSLALPALGSFLRSRDSTPELNDAELANHDFLEAFRHFAFTRPNKVLRPVDYRNLATEELGGVYEGLLELTPRVSGDGADFTLERFAGNRRKKTGGFYAPDSLVQCPRIRRWTRWWRRQCAARPAPTPSE